jgi:radical SAM superfamily enzyme YgiQ (UPF0313 family)
VGFVVPRWNDRPDPQVQGLPFRALPVAGALYHAGFEVVFCDQDRDLDRAGGWDELLARLAPCRLALFWLADFEPLLQITNLLRIAARLKDRFPALRLAAGGEILSVLPLESLDTSGPIDFFLRGYGEAGAPLLVEAVRGRAPFEDVPGLVWTARTRRYNPEPLAERIRSEHLAPYRLLDLSGWIQRGGIFGNGLGTLLVGSGRGCAKRCDFCYHRNHRLSVLSARELVDLVALLRERTGVRQFHLAELDFLASRERALELARRWRERLPDSTWFALASVVDGIRLGEAELALLAEGGCRKLELGTESGSGRVLRSMGKRHAPEDALELSRRLLRQGIVPMHNFLFGTVGETEADRRESFNLIRRLLELDERVVLTFRIYQPLWETPMGEAALARSPGYPRRIDELLAHRHEYGEEDRHAMGWLDAAVERRIKQMVFHDLPLAASRLEVSGRVPRWAYRTLRDRARARVSEGAAAGPLERWLYRRLVARTLDHTFRCGSA